MGSKDNYDANDYADHHVAMLKDDAMIDWSDSGPDDIPTLAYPAVGGDTNALAQPTSNI